MSQKKKGVVLLLGSVAGYQGSFSAALYSASKHAITGFTRSVGDLDGLKGVKVVCVCPGCDLSSLLVCVYSSPSKIGEPSLDTSKIAS